MGQRDLDIGIHSLHVCASEAVSIRWFHARGAGAFTRGWSGMGEFGSSVDNQLRGLGGSLLAEPTCTTLSYMKTTSVTIRLDAKLQRELARLSRQLGRSRSEVIRDALRRQLALVQFEQIRRGLLPLAEAKGIITDEDVFAIVS